MPIAHRQVSDTGSTPTLVFLGSGRCYHTMDWFRSAQAARPENPPVLVTDLLEGESFERLVRPGDRVISLSVLDDHLFHRQSRIGDLWRNAVKLAFLPLQVLRLRRILATFDEPIILAHSMYYIGLARLSSRKYLATPQGSELLVRPYNSRAYRLWARAALAKASAITVDSVAMKRSLSELFGQDALVIQNGIDVAAIEQERNEPARRERIVSIRAITANYQIDKLIESRNRTMPKTPVDFCYPFVEKQYRSQTFHRCIAGDRDLGRVTRLNLYRKLQEAKLTVSIPKSDSSPRSVYEAIFCGSIVAVTKQGWIDDLPACMASRLVVVDPAEKDWLRDAIGFAESKSNEPFEPSPLAEDLFDQRRSISKVLELVDSLATSS